MEDGAISMIESITSQQIKTNGKVIPGQIEPPSGFGGSDDRYGGYEDEGTWEEMKKDSDGDDSGTVSPCPTLVVTIPEMPKCAIVEVEVIAVTEKVASNLEMKDASAKQQICVDRQQNNTSCSPLGWNTGHTFESTQQQTTNAQIHLYSCSRRIGHRCAANALVVAAAPAPIGDIITVGIDALLQDMFASVDKVLAEGRSGLNSADTIHARLHYIGATLSNATNAVVAVNDGSQLQSSLGSAIGTWAANNQRNTKASLPSASAISVSGLGLINSTFNMENETPLLALHAMVADPVHFETERWISSDREYNT